MKVALCKPRGALWGRNSSFPPALRNRCQSADFPLPASSSDIKLSKPFVLWYFATVSLALKGRTG